MPDIGQDFRLRGIAFGPVPFLLQLFAEGIAVIHRKCVAPRPGIAVVIPYPAHIRAALDTQNVPAIVAQAVDAIETRKTGANDNDIMVHRFRHSPSRFLGG